MTQRLPLNPLLQLLLTLTLLGSFSGHAKDADAVDFYAFASSFTVKVITRSANIFSGDVSSGHGTGFFVEVRKNTEGEDIGVFFTNRHVVERPAYVYAREVIVNFPTDTDIPESVRGQVVYESSYNDLAVIEIKMKDLKRVRKSVHPARLPDPTDPATKDIYNFVENHRQFQGLEVVAHGSPLDSDSVSTFGRITGRWTGLMGSFIQTQTPINPGNSGGPLIELESGLVIGINTMKITDADNTGFALPIGVALDDYHSWRANPKIAHTKRLGVFWGISEKDELEVLGYASLIRKKYPEFFNHFAAALRVDDTLDGNGLKVGDILIKVEGELISPNIHALDKLTQQSTGKMKTELIRNGEWKSVTVPVSDRSYDLARSALDFTLISGMLFTDYQASDWDRRQCESAVVITGDFGETENTFSMVNMPDILSQLLQVNIDNKVYKIKTLFDLKKALRSNPKARFMRMTVREPITDRNGNPYQNGLGGVAFQPQTTSYLVPITEVITPSNFSIHKFVKQYSFARGEPERRDWRRFVRPWSKVCEKALTKKRS